MAKLNPLFKAQNRAGRRKVLNTLDISARDKNNVLNNMDKTSTNGGGGNEVSSGFRYKSNKVVWEIDWDKVDEYGSDNMFTLLQALSCYIPFYCVCINEKTYPDWDAKFYYGFFATAMFNISLYDSVFGNVRYKPLYIEEAESIIMDSPAGKLKIDGIKGLCALQHEIPIEEVTDEIVYNTFCLKPVDYDEFVEDRKRLNDYENFLE